MNTQDFRTMNKEDLAARVTSMQHEYFTAKEAVRSGKEKNQSSLRGLRHDIARALTVLNEGQEA
jgi:ribosomal protein L29